MTIIKKMLKDQINIMRFNKTMTKTESLRLKVLNMVYKRMLKEKNNG